MAKLRASTPDLQELSYATFSKGVSARSIKRYLDSGLLTESDIVSVVPKRTFDRRVAEDQALKDLEADAILRLMRVRRHARRVFDDHRRAETWLSTPNPSLAGAIPIDMSRTDLGAREVEAVLTRFEHGVFG